MFSGLAAERLLLTLWVGGLLAIGYLAVPMAFVTLADVSLAGDYAGKLFSTVILLGIGCAIALLLAKFIAYGKRAITLWRVWLMLVILALSVVFIGYLQPEMSLIKASEDWRSNEILSAQFSFLHALSSKLYLVMTVLGVVLVVSNDDYLEKSGVLSHGEK